ncbi:acyltransferase [Rhizobium sp. ARZ01]|uniref:acyltransferase family protein n=1 Tax=Rhizobium sp. ARZ01 TaxID=2769313 RepID=UPI001784E62A|nr:acyltransferase [Rhizobium sp. ARZ01]MBD9371647.1 acyltransferase [Rhizobium sp. ARZ01]
MNGPNHIKSLDGLRGLAAAIVLVSHIPLIFPEFGPLPYLDIGTEAVGIFFALSGFLMAYLYGGRPVTRESVLDFLVSRFARIYPVYLAAVCLVGLLSAAVQLGYPQPIASVMDFILHVVLLGKSGVFWSVPPEIQFYGAFPVIWLFLSDPRRYQAIGFGLLGVVAVVSLLDFPGPGILLHAKLPYFLFGVVAGRLHQNLSDRPPSAAIGVMAVVLLVVFFSYKHVTPTTGEPFWGLPTAFASALIVALIAREHPVTARILSSGPLRFLGVTSFSLYLFHVPVMFLTRQTFSAFLPMPVLAVLTLVTALLAAWVSYNVIEAPSRCRLGEFWRASRLRHDLLRRPITLVGKRGTKRTVGVGGVSV